MNHFGGGRGGIGVSMGGLQISRRGLDEEDHLCGYG